jgi:hypothetical protein
MIPTGLRHPSLTYIDNRFNPTDFLNNIILYLPLGIALSGSSLLRAFLFGLCLSTGAEVLQLGYIDRVPSFLDITSNTLGAVAGFLLARFCFTKGARGAKSVSLPGPVAAAAIPIAILGSVMLLYHRPASDFSDWDPRFHLVVGNELTGDRPWTGNISEFVLYPFAMSVPQIDDLARSAANSDTAFAGAVSALPQAPVIGPMQLGDVTTGPAHRLLSQQEEQKLYHALVGQNQLTLLVLLQTNNLEQTGTARIITYSKDAYNRNFMLGQIRDTLTFRVRTPASGPSGLDPALYTEPVLSLDRTTFIAATYDGRISRLYVDGKQVAQADLGARRPRIPKRILSWLPGSIPIREIELCGSEILLSGLFSIGIFALGGVPRRWLVRYAVGALAGAAIGAVIWIFGVSRPWLGTRILMECVAAGLLISASVEAPEPDSSGCSSIFDRGSHGPSARPRK